MAGAKILLLFAIWLLRTDEKRYLAMLAKVIKTRSLYYSPTYDITLSQQVA